ncbi:MAG: MBL fold metallo-hydrolase [Candidatus Pacebacteria bacterium]|nr:MBL fold metallo-hydrolase [Candidatus Paceibacterota bacterium]MCD8508220.1 MBL fold metallo-hydrolase [Candidatus Paceibacterota bacterium]MCD8527965.1 MBL fold metallo-hydrolase [Candidatus Paceibacterota bacterium]MCD8563584.1 MBL fold metallo-hydrolase [Candidatus Paceibacterota bacterium]
MIITHHGKQFFKLQVGDTIIALNPIGKDTDSGKVSKFGADIALSSVQHPLYHGFENVTYGDKEPFTIDSPGSYEVHGYFIQGLMTQTILDGREYINTIYYFTFDDIKILFLGALTSKEIPAAVQEVIEDVDIIFVPVGQGLLMPAEAHKLAVSFNPHIIIPMGYDQESLTQFVKEGGDAQVSAEPKLTLKYKDLAGKKAEIIPLA